MRARLLYNGALVVLLGLLAGFPYALVVTGQMAGEERAWRMAHLEGLLNGMLALIAAGVWDSLVLSARQRRWLALSLILAAWGNAVASILAASAGVRGLALAGPPLNAVVYLLFVAAIVAVFIGVGLLVRGGALAIGAARD
ncbi:MAG: hypothetical protein ACREBE_27065 [bacterium]